MSDQLHHCSFKQITFCNGNTNKSMWYPTWCGLLSPALFLKKTELYSISGLACQQTKRNKKLKTFKFKGEFEPFSTLACCPMSPSAVRNKNEKIWSRIVNRAKGPLLLYFYVVPNSLILFHTGGTQIWKRLEFSFNVHYCLYSQWWKGIHFLKGTQQEQKG